MNIEALESNFRNANNITDEMDAAEEIILTSIFWMQENATMSQALTYGETMREVIDSNNITKIRKATNQCIKAMKGKVKLAA